MAASLLTRARALLECSAYPGSRARAAESVSAVHEAVVVEIACADHGAVHSLVACEECGLCAAVVLEDEECPLVQEIAEALELEL